MHAKAAQRQIFSFALVALFLAAQVSSFTHELLVRHVTCPEHGELIHADESTAGSPAEEPALAVRAAPAAISTHGHEHCLACTARRGQLFIAAPTAALVVAPALKLAAGAARRTTPAPVALLRLAPKSSPPA